MFVGYGVRHSVMPQLSTVSSSEEPSNTGLLAAGPGKMRSLDTSLLMQLQQQRQTLDFAL